MTMRRPVSNIPLHKLEQSINDAEYRLSDYECKLLSIQRQRTPTHNQLDIEFTQQIIALHRQYLGKLRRIIDGRKNKP